MKAKILMGLLAGIVLLAACKGTIKGSNNYEAINNSIADSVAKADSIVNALKLVKTAGIDFKVKNVQQCSDKISALTNRYKGMVIHHAISSTANSTNDIKISDDSIMRVSAFNTTGEMTVRMPSESLNEYLDSVGRLGIYVNNSHLDIEDKSLDYLSSQMKVNNRRELVSQQKQGKVIIKSPTAVLNLKDDLVDEQIDNRRINDAVKYSVVNLNFYQSNTIVKEIIANDNPSAYNIQFFKRLGLALENGWYILKELIIAMANCWALILAGLAIWWAIRFYKRKARLAPNAI